VPDLSEPAGPEPAGADPTGEPVAGGALAPTQRPSRAGRNLPLAIGIGVLLAALVVSTVNWFPVGFVVVVAVAFSIAAVELVLAVATAGARAATGPLVAGTVAMVFAAYYGGLPGLAVAFVSTVLVLIFWRIPGGTDGAVRDVTASLWIAAYPAFLGSFATLMFAQHHGADRVIVFITLTVCSDTGGYALGVLRGKHPMAPQISPKKSWEGFAGSVIACLLGGWLVAGWLLDTKPWQGLLLGLAVVLVATLGDLAESMVKRDLGLKDMGRLLPGHGGMMDRLDSLVPVAPVVYVLLALFVGR
jgi:phosphatidate cytidylyltransferase